MRFLAEQDWRYVRAPHTDDPEWIEVQDAANRLGVTIRCSFGKSYVANVEPETQVPDDGKLPA